MGAGSREVHEVDHHVVGAGGLRLAATSFGPPDGAGVLFLHGFGQTRHAWRTVARRLAAAGWRVTTLDMRGHGDSPWAPEYRLADFEEDVRLAAATFPSRPALVGASLGGILALVTQADHGIAAALALVDVVPHFTDSGGRRVQGFMAEHRDGFASLEEAATAVAGFLQHRARPEKVDGLLRNLVQDETGHLHWKWDPRFATGVDWMADAAGDIDEVSEQMRIRMTDAATTLTIPTLLVRGRLSDFVTEDAARSFLGLVPHASYADVAGAGHMVAGDRNDAFGDAVVAFLTANHPTADRAGLSG